MKTQTTRPRMTIAQRQAVLARGSCPHAKYIELADGVRVCTLCEAVLAPEQTASPTR